MIDLVDTIKLIKSADDISVTPYNSYELQFAFKDSFQTEYDIVFLREQSVSIVDTKTGIQIGKFMEPEAVVAVDKAIQDKMAEFAGLVGKKAIELTKERLVKFLRKTVNVDIGGR